MTSQQYVGFRCPRANAAPILDFNSSKRSKQHLCKKSIEVFKRLALELTGFDFTQFRGELRAWVSCSGLLSTFVVNG